MARHTHLPDESPGADKELGNEIGLQVVLVQP
jgi:hypothetical protein